MKEMDVNVISRYAEWVTSSILTITTWYNISEAKAKLIYNRKNKHRNWNKKSTEAIRFKDYDQSTKKLVTQMFLHELRVSDKTSSVLTFLRCQKICEFEHIWQTMLFRTKWSLYILLIASTSYKELIDTSTQFYKYSLHSVISVNIINILLLDKTFVLWSNFSMVS